MPNVVVAKYCLFVFINTESMVDLGGNDSFPINEIKTDKTVFINNDLKNHVIQIMYHLTPISLRYSL